MNCQHCHTCGTKLLIVLDGEEWCPVCEQYRRYKSHGWTAEPGNEAKTQCFHGDYRIFNRPMDDGSYRPLSEYFEREHE